ncbi:Hypothetical predicted protein, partial [Paramuricea clavata]
FLRRLVRKILEKCHELGAYSLAIPMIGAGQHGYSEKVVLQIIREVVNQFSNSKGSQITLKDIRVIVFQSKPDRRQSVPLPIRPGISTPSLSHPSERNTEASSTEIAFALVRIYLCGGNLTQYEADAFMNLSSTNVKVSTTTSLKPPPGTVLVIKAHGGVNVKYYVHCVPVSFDISGLERAIKASLEAAKFFALNNIVISATGITSLNPAANECANAILNASKIFSKANFMMDIKVVVFDVNMMRIFKNAFEENAKEQKTSATIHDIDQAASLEDAEIMQQLPLKKVFNIGVKEQVIFRVVGVRDNVNKSIEKIEGYSNRFKVTKYVTDEKMVYRLWKHISEMETLSKGYDVFITLSAEKVSIEGMADQVFECKDALIDFLNKHDEKEREMRRLREMSESVQWLYTDVNGTVLFDEILNGMVESKFRDGNNKITFPGTGNTYEVDSDKMVIQETHTGRTASLARKQIGKMS